MAAARVVDLAGARLACPCHVVAFFNSKADEDSVLLPFMAAGIAAGEKCINVIDKTRRANRLAALVSVGIDVVIAQGHGQLELLPWERAHLVGGVFDQTGMLDRLEAAAVRDEAAYPATRFWSNQEWALLNAPGTEDIVEYESRFNYIWPKHNTVAVCVYDTSKHSPALLEQILRAHPFAIIDNVLVENPSYVPPDDLLREIGRPLGGRPN